MTERADRKDGRATESGGPADLGLMLAFALILAYAESLLPFTFGIPGVKLGLANLAVLLTLYRTGARQALLVSMLRIVLNGFVFGNLYGILYSLAGGLLSFLAMYLAKKTKCFSLLGVSIAGGVFHNTGQIAVAAFVVETKGLYYYLPFLLAAGVVTGFLIGMVSGQVLRRLPGSKTEKKEL